MEFEHSATQRQIRDAVREFCEAEIEPIAQSIEAEHRFPAELFEQLSALDLLGVPIDEQWGGLGSNMTTYALVAEELGRVSGAVGLSYVAHTSLGAKPIQMFGTDEQKSRWLEPLARGAELGAWALTEPTSGSDASELRTTARREGSEFVLDGVKQFITNANVAGSVLVKAQTIPEGETFDPANAGTDTISTFILDPDDEGFEVTSVWEKLGLNASPTCEVTLTDCRIPESRLLGDAGDGWEQTLKTLQGGRISIAALSVGLAQGAFEAARDYAGERSQFDQPIATFDAIRDLLVEMHRKTERARLLTQKAASRADAGEAVERESALAKLDASEAAREVAESAVQVLGGNGYTTAYAPQRFYRDAKLMEIGEGTSQIQRLVLGRELGF